MIEASTGKVIYEKNVEEQLLMAYMTKMMTLLLIMDNIESGNYNGIRECCFYVRFSNIFECWRKNECRRLDNHYSSAYDMAIIAKELVRHEKY